jgi:tRNA(fMet)-specific endonuclease VapC
MKSKARIPGGQPRPPKRANSGPIPTNDLWIAALVIQRDLVLLTRDAHFKHLPQLARL